MTSNIDSDSDIETFESDEKSHIPDISEVNFTTKEKYYFKMVDKFFKNLDENKITKMIDIVEGRSRISLRLFDWFVTCYACKFKDNTRYQLKSTNEWYNVHIGYKSQLKSYKKRYFDPFRRRKKFIYTMKNKKLVTTIGQLNFFRWAFMHEVINYAEKNYDTLSRAMILYNKEVKERKKREKVVKKPKKQEAKKNNVTVSAKTVKPIPQNNVMKIVLSFDD